MATTNWSVDPAAFAGVVEEELAKRRTLIALDTHKNIVLRTPVDTGHARRNWVISYNTEPSGTVGKAGGDSLSDAEASTVANTAISKGYQDLLPGAKEPFTKVIISNNLPYIGKLENGSSKQAPQGMVAVTVVGINKKYS